MTIENLMKKDFVIQTNSNGKVGQCSICNKGTNGKIVIETDSGDAFNACPLCASEIIADMFIRNCEIKMSNDVLYARNRG